MKVIHILYELKFSGAEIMYVDAADSFQKKGCDLTVVAIANNLGEYAPYFEQASYKVLHLPYPPISNYWKRILYFKMFIKFLRQNSYDVVHIHSHGAMWGFSLCAWLANIKSVYTFHNVFPSGFFTYPYHCLRRWTAKYIFKCRLQTISDSVHNHERNFYHTKTVKIYNWFNNKRFYPAEAGERNLFRKELGIAENAFVLISVGGCSDVKQHSEIILALNLLAPKIPDCVYLHLGSGKAEQEEVNLSKELNLSNQIRFIGNKSDIRKYLVASDLYLMTSKFEGISISTIEAMACNVPTILYDVPGLRDFNVRGKISEIIPPNYQALAAEIIKYHDNPSESLLLAGKAKSMMDQLYDLNTNSQAIFSLYTN